MRAEKVEMLFARLKRILKLDRLRLRGPCGARDEFLLAVTACGAPPATEFFNIIDPKQMGWMHHFILEAKDRVDSNEPGTWPSF
jgi:hypothetical protein